MLIILLNKHNIIIFLFLEHHSSNLELMLGVQIMDTINPLTGVYFTRVIGKGGKLDHLDPFTAR